MSNYIAMQNRMADEINRDDVGDQIKDAIQSAIAHYENEVFHFNQARATDATVASTEYYNLPSDFIRNESLVVTVNQTKYPLEQKTWDWFEDISTTTTYTGYPHYYTIWGEQYRLYPIPDATYTLTQAYIKSLGTLSENGDTNAWMVDGFELIKSRAMKLILTNKIRDLERAQFFAQQEAEALRNLKGRRAGYSSSIVRSTHF